MSVLRLDFAITKQYNRGIREREKGNAVMVNAEHMYYIAYYADGNDNDGDCPDMNVAEAVKWAWTDNMDGFEAMGPAPIKVEVYSTDHKLLATQEN